MIVVNGYIRILSEEEDFDENGCPVVGEESSLGNPIPCNFVRNTYEKRGSYEDGVFTTSSYTILIENMPFEPCTFWLYDRLENFLGEFIVHQKGILNLQAVGAIQLTV